jgi:UDP:flavonoid glycosyltransferase YjiC (YdhE family)
LRTVYSWGDYTLYADVPELVPTRKLPPNHRHIGPPCWSTSTPLPGWWDDLPPDRPVVLLTLGSSGRADLLPMALSALSGLPITVIAATAGKIDLADVPGNAFVADYLPLDRAVQRSRLVICNGGSLTTYQALASGVPILGLCTNMDQLLNMNAIERLGESVARLLDQPPSVQAASRIGRLLSQLDSAQAFREVVDDMLRHPRKD